MKPEPDRPARLEDVGIGWCKLANLMGDDDRIQKPEEEWQKELSPEEYRVTRQCGTEPPFTGRYWDTHTPGVYRCVACGEPLYSSDTKYDSGTGWPSFWEPIAEDRVETDVDESHGMIRTEVHCRRCGAHLGHIFPDGPPPTGTRHCVNSASLRLEPR